MLVEGFKEGVFPKVEVWRAVVGKPLLWQQWPDIVSVASDGPPPHGVAAPELWLPLDDIDAVAECVLQQGQTLR